MSTATAAPPAPTAAASPRPAVGQIVGAFMMPVFFIVMLCATLVTALHHTQPHDLALRITGPTSIAQQVASGIDRTSPGSFDITQGGSAASARADVLDRDAVGAVVIGGSSSKPTVTVYTAGAGGRSAAAAVSAVGTQIATQLNTTADVQDVAPVVPADSLGTGLFYLISYAGIAGYLTVVVLSQVIPRARLRTRLAFSVGAAVVAPVVAIGLGSIFFDGWSVNFGQLAGLFGVLALYVFTVTLIAIVATQLLGNAAIFGISPFVIFVNLPSAGGAAPEAMLPGFWQAMHSFWFGAGAYESIRDIVYFPQADPIRWIIQLLLWTIGALVAVLLIHAVKLIWRLQSMVLRAEHHADTVSEHLHLMSVPRPNETLRQVTALNGAPAAASAPRSEEQEPHPDDDSQATAATEPSPTGAGR